MCVSVANVVLKVSPAYGDWCDVLKLAPCETLQVGIKEINPTIFIKVGRKMKIINENLEMVDFKEKSTPKEDTTDGHYSRL